MVKTVGELSVAELERLLTGRKSKLESLIKKRGRLQKELVRVDKQISVLEGRKTVARSVNRRGKRPKNAKPLHVHAKEILAKNKKGLPLGSLKRKIIDAGYKSRSKNFGNVLYQSLYKSAEIVHDEKTKAYRLKATS